MPTITPVGTVFVRDTPGAYYFDQYTSALARNLDADPRICMMAVNSGSLFWLRALLRSRFPTPPGIRLYGTAGPRREATPDELARVRARVRPMRLLPGARLLWSDFTHVRDLTFTHFRLVRYPMMMPSGWPADDDPTTSAG